MDSSFSHMFRRKRRFKLPPDLRLQPVPLQSQTFLVFEQRTDESWDGMRCGQVLVSNTRPVTTLSESRQLKICGFQFDYSIYCPNMLNCAWGRGGVENDVDFDTAICEPWRTWRRTHPPRSPKPADQPTNPYLSWNSSFSLGVLTPGHLSHFQCACERHNLRWVNLEISR